MDRRVRAVMFTALAALFFSLATGMALAHVELSASTPAPGGAMPTVDVVRLEFSTSATVAGEGVLIYDVTGTPIDATIATPSETVVTITPMEPLAPGEYLVSWTMRAGDAHPRSGTFTFTVTDPGAARPIQDSEAASASEPEPSTVFAELTARPSTATADWIGRIARVLGFTAVLLGLGAFVFAALVFSGSESEARRVGFWGRRAGAIIMLTVPMEVASQAMLLDGGSVFAALDPTMLPPALGGSFGLAMLLRAMGGLGLLLGTRLVTELIDQRPPGGGDAAVATLRERTFRVTASPIAVAGAASVALSFLFDGHTAVTAPSWLVRLASMIHVLAAATWVGGVAMLAVLFAGRSRRGQPLGAARLVIPFSTVAAGAVTLVGIAGGVLALTTVDAISEFFTTPWGRALLAKLVLVGVAAAIGAYNHKRLVPALRAGDSDGTASQAIARSVRIETVVLLAAIAATAVLVGLAS